MDIRCSDRPANTNASPYTSGPPSLDEAPPLRVLVVEDELMIALTLESMVEDFGYTVCATAMSGEEAVRKAVQTRPDVILMDINLGPGIDGIEAARLAREALGVRIVFVTAYGSASVMARIGTAMPDAVIVNKPVDSETLLNAIRRTGLS